MKQLIKVIIIFSILLLGACTAAAPPEQAADSIGETVTLPAGSYTNITPNELNTMMENKDFLLVNVHIPYEGDIPGTDLSIPYNDIESHLDLLPEDPDARIVVYCKSDPMSVMAAETLLEMGYTNLYNLSGGFVAWSAEGLPLEE